MGRAIRPKLSTSGIRHSKPQTEEATMSALFILITLAIAALWIYIYFGLIGKYNIVPHVERVGVFVFILELVLALVTIMGPSIFYGLLI